MHRCEFGEAGKTEINKVEGVRGETRWSLQIELERQSQEALTKTTLMQACFFFQVPTPRTVSKVQTCV